MRLILDTDTSHKILPDREPKVRDVLLRNWLSDGHGVVCYTLCGKLGEETRGTKTYMGLLQTWKEKGKALAFSERQMHEAEAKFADREIRSDDHGMLALCIASNAAFIGTQDGDLIIDIGRLVADITGGNPKIYPVKERKGKEQPFLGITSVTDCDSGVLPSPNSG